MLVSGQGSSKGPQKALKSLTLKGLIGALGAALKSLIGALGAALESLIGPLGTALRARALRGGP